MKRRVIKYLSITKKDWNGLVVLVALILLILAAPYLYLYFHKDTPINLKDFYAASVRLKQAGDTLEEAGLADSAQKVVNPHMFLFDPNNTGVKQWQQLGLSLHQAAVIEHYKAKGGKFFSKADVKKMYTITGDDYERLQPYINLPLTLSGKVVTAVKLIELNSADSAKLTTLRGIGPSYAARIISYRNRLGGFISKEQLKEVYGLDSDLYGQVKHDVFVRASLIKPITINKISVNQLRIFPYLKYKQANAIIEYRTQHGAFTSMADLNNIAILDAQVLAKIKPYLSFK